jgi:hypothetical protein
MDFTTIMFIGLASMPGAISGPQTNSYGTSYSAPSCAGTGPCYVPAMTSPVSQTPCGEGYGHSTAYNYGVYPVQSYLYAAPRAQTHASAYNSEK